MSNPLKKQTWKEKIVNLIDEGNIYVCVAAVIVLNIIAYVASLWIGIDKAESHISCVVGLVSLGFSAWVAYWAKSLHNHACNNFVKKILLDLMKDWDNEYKGIIEQLGEKEIERAISTYEYSLANGKYLKPDVKRAIESAIEQLKEAKENNSFFGSSQFKSQLKNIINLTSELNH